MARRHVALLLGAVLLVAGAPALAGGSSARRFGTVAPLVVVGPAAVTAGGGGRASSSKVSARTLVQLEVALRPSHPGKIAALLHGLYDPASSEYHRFLPRGAFLARFRPAPATVARLRSYLDRRHLATRLEGFALSVRGRAGAVASAFHVRLAELAGSVAAATSPFRLPRDLAGAVDGVVDARLRADVVPHLVQTPIQLPGGRPGGPAAVAGSGGLRPGAARQAAKVPAARVGVPAAHVGAASAVPTACATASEIATLNHAVTLDQLSARYGITPLLAAGDNGRGVTVAVYELAAHSPSDVAAFLACEGIDPSITTVPVDGGGTTQAGGGTTEADLDLEQVATQAPGATILAYEGPATAAGQYDVWAAIVGQDRAAVVSTSWGICEAAAEGSVPGEATLLQQAAAQGQTIVAASGDSGTEDCFPSGATTAAVDFPASDPYVTAVGGTTLAGPADVVWNTCGAGSMSCADNGGHASGGGVSSLFTEPSWQQSVLPDPPAGGCPAGGCRGVPDVVANAGTTEVVYDGGGWAGAGGTSAASPLVAGLAADLTNTCSGRLGDLSPALYAIAAQGGGTALVGVTSGTNDLTGATGANYAAGPGYTLAGGLGTPVGTGLACPSITGILPAQALPGTEVTVVGTDLSHATIDFGSASATVVQASATSATVVVPAGAGMVTVQGASPLGRGAATASFTYGAPASGPAGGWSAAVGGSSASRPVDATGAVAGGASTTSSAALTPAGVRWRVQRRLLALSWRRPGGALRGYLLLVRACAIGRSCALRRYLLAPGRITAKLHLPPGRYALRLVALYDAGDSRPVRRFVRIVAARRAPPPRSSGWSRS